MKQEGDCNYCVHSRDSDNDAEAWNKNEEEETGRHNKKAIMAVFF